jgi:hypothetical protein
MKNGYGQFWMGDRLELAHRAAWLLFRGAIPEGLFMCHRCDVRSCVNPAHLFIGSAKDNMLDCSLKGRLGGTFQFQDRCARGHLDWAERKNSSSNKGTRRVCLTCKRESDRKRRLPCQTS